MKIHLSPSQTPFAKVSLAGKLKWIIFIILFCFSNSLSAGLRLLHPHGRITTPGIRGGNVGENIVNSSKKTLEAFLLPTIGYSGPQLYVAGSAIAPLVPTSSGVAPAGYSTSPVTLSSAFSLPAGVALDGFGNLYVADAGNNTIKEIPAGGGSIVTLGPAFSSPAGLAVDGSGNIFVADYSNNAIKEIPSGGGPPVTVGTGFLHPAGVAVDITGNIYVADAGNGMVKKIPAGGGAIVTLGTGFSTPNSVAVDLAGNVYVTDAGNSLVKKILASNGAVVSIGSGFNSPANVAVDAAGNVIVADAGNNAVKMIVATTQTIVTLGSGFNSPNGVVIDASGNVYVSDQLNNSVKEIKPVGGYYIGARFPAGLSFDSATGTISGIPVIESPATNYTITAYNASGSISTTVNIKINALAISYSGPQTYVAGTAVPVLAPASSNVAAPGYSNTAITVASGFNGPAGVAVDAAGDLYIADYANSQVEENPAVGPNVLIGSGFIGPSGVAVDAAGNVFVVDRNKNLVRKFPVGGGPSTNIGSGFTGPIAVAVDAIGNVYVADLGNNAVKEVPANGSAIITIGSGFNNPYGVAVDAAGNVYVTDHGNNSVKEILAIGGDPITLATGFNGPYGIAVDASGNVFVGDQGNNAVKEIPVGSHTPITIGPGFNFPAGVAVDGAGDVFVCDYQNNMIKEIKPTGGYYINNAIPPGLTFNNSNGSISGTPTAQTPAKNYTITAYSAAGNNSASVIIKVNLPPAPTISYSSPQTYTAGTAITSLAPVSNGVTALAYNSNTVPFASGFKNPGGIAIDTSGNLYVIDQFHNQVKMIPAGGGTPIVIANILGNLSAIAVDIHKNVYITNGELNVVTKIKAGSGDTVTIAKGFSNPTGIAVDTAGNVYVADNVHQLIKKILAADGSIVVINTSLTVPFSLAIDAAGNLFLTNEANTEKMIPVNGDPVVNIGSNLGTSFNLAVDPSGNVVASFFGLSILKVLPGGKGNPINAGSAFYPVDGVAIDGTGTIYATDDWTNTVRQIRPSGGYFINKPLPAGLNFDSYTGTISGTPTALSPATNYTITAYNPGGGTQATVSIKVSLPSLPAISYNGPQSYKTNTAISPLMPTGTGIAITGFNNHPVTVGYGFNYPTGAATDALGNIYLVDYGANAVKEIPVGGGSPVILGSGFNHPFGIAADRLGNIYVADAGNNAVKKILVGGGVPVTLGFGFNSPTGVAVDADGNVYVVDQGNNAVKKIPAGSNTPVTIGSGFNNPIGIALDQAGNIYVTSSVGNGLKKIPAGGGIPVTLVPGFQNAMGVAVDIAGNIFLSNALTSAVSMIPVGTNNMITIGSGFVFPFGLAVDPSGNVYVADGNNKALKEIKRTGGYYINPVLPAGLNFDSATGIISGTPTVLSPAGDYAVTGYNSGGSVKTSVNIKVSSLTLSYNGPQNYAAGAPIVALAPTSNGVAPPAYNNTAVTIGPGFNSPFGIAADVYGNAFVSDQSNNFVKKIPAGGGAAVIIAAGLNQPRGVAVDAGGNVYIADAGNNQIKEILVEGGQPLILGSGFLTPSGVAVDAAGNVFVADEGNNAVKMIPAGGGAPVILGSGFNQPFGVAVDAMGNVFVADAGSNAIKEIPKGGGAGPFTLGSGFSSPFSVAVDASGNIYVADTGNNLIKMLPAGVSPIVPVTIGGPAFTTPAGVAVDGAGNVYVADDNDNAVKEIFPLGGYFISPFLPSGLNFNNTTGIVSGTPLAVSPARNYTVTAYNTGGYNTAAINIKISPSSDANLFNLTIDKGTLSPAFTAAKTSYLDTVNNATTAVILTPTTNNMLAPVMVNGIMVTSGSASANVPLVVGNNAVHVVVHAQDGTQRTYTVTVTRLSNNANLANLVISSGTPAPAFATATTTYTASVSNAVASITVTPTTSDTRATVKVSGISTVSGTASASIPLNAGLNNIYAVVLAQDGTKRTYTITITRALSSNANLSNLVVSSGTLNPAFILSTANYLDTVNNATASIKLTPTTGDANATVQVNGVTVVSGAASASVPISVGSNAIHAVVHAQDGTQKTYTVTVTRLSNNANLANLTINSGTLSPAFTSPIPGYTDTVSNAVSSVLITPTTSEAHATVKINGTTVASGTASQPLPLVVGNNVFHAVVLAQDGTQKTYTITVRRLTPGGLNNLYVPGKDEQTPEISALAAKVEASNLLSPNGDGINDIWVVKNIDRYPDNTVTVYDRSGKIVFAEKGYVNDWGGTYRGSVLNEGTYYYLINLGSGPVIKGFITVMKDR